ncbi:MAG: MarR family transcriptional regulator [Betaproteobacteria bacterium]|nr:MarR family transcriptional regulator [Betaproteobacteria bacterium]
MATKRRLELRIGDAGAVLDRLEQKWNRLAAGETLEPERVLTLPDLPALLAALTPARWVLIGKLRAEGPLSVYELAKRLGRDYKNVHTDVRRLIELEVVERRDAKRVGVAWDLVRAEIRLGA